MKAGLEIAARAAITVHDSHLGGAGVYHLFRLPRSWEIAIGEELTQGKPDLGELASGSKSEALDMLIGLAGTEPLAVATGPVSCGRVGALKRGRALQRLCAVYAAAFQSDIAAFPYLEAEES